MRVWTMHREEEHGIQQEYYECTPSGQCDNCKIRFKCYTNKDFDLRGGYEPTEDSLSPAEFCYFLVMKDKCGYARRE